MTANPNLAVFVDSFDGYSDLWPTFFEIFDHYWPDCPYKKYLVNNEKVFEHPGVDVISTGPEVNWFDRTIHAAESLSEDYLLFFLEDYFLGKRIDNSAFDEVMTYVVEKDIEYYRLTLFKTYREGWLVSICTDKRYPIDLALCIWKREAFVDILKEIQASGYTSPWDFEIYFIEKYRGLEQHHPIPGAVCDMRDIMGYHNGVLKGKWIRKTLAYYRREGIEIDTRGRELMTVPATVYYDLELFIKDHFDDSVRLALKNMMKKLGFKFATDY